GDTLATVTTGTAAFATTADVTSNVGKYAVTGSGLAAASSNYAVTFAQNATNATALSVTPAPLTVTYTATAASRPYGAAKPALTGTVA
ncbi:MBG domain-containing protein, partial [Streptomyces turgidiscabies]|uniref:MBG domain-containing protein n=1 Tax=Streptomyces turgidiscabies TaxID=85558 RepID=UPI0038F6F206